MQGRSLLPVFDQSARNWRSAFLVEYFSDTVFPRIRSMGYVAVRTTGDKYIQYQELEHMNELYDLEKDPHQLDSLAATADPGLLARLSSRLSQLKSCAGESCRS